MLRTVRTTGEATSGEVYDELKKTRDVAYTSVTTTLYRLVDKDLLSVRKVSEKRVFYRIKDGRAYRRAMSSMVESLLDTFGGAAVSYILDNPARLTPDQAAVLQKQIELRRKKEALHE